MLYGASFFNGDLNKWGVAGHCPTRMVYGAPSFIGNLKWDVTKVTAWHARLMVPRPSTVTSTSGALQRSRPTHMAYGASSFHGNLNKWEFAKSQSGAHGLWCLVLQR